MRQSTFEFLIEVGDRVGDGYRLTFAYPDPDSPTGTGGHSAVAPLDPADAALRAQLAMLPTMVLASAAKSRLAVSPMEQAARAVGDQLFRALTGGETLGELARLRRRAQAAGADVRLALRVRPPELAALPWEYLFDAREDRREFLGRSCMVTRSAGDLRTVPALPVAGPLRVLAMVAVPGDQAALDVERERGYLEAALAPMRAAGRLELAWVPATKQALLSATQRQRWHIVHYIGHGDFDAATGAGRLAFAAEDGGGTDWVTARQLATILGAHPTLRLVVLNACQSSAGSAEDGQAGLAAALVHAGLAAVVAMQFPITDDAAPVFGREFYGALAAGEPVDRCVRAGRAAITLANDASLEWGTPVLHLRSTDGALFALAESHDGAAAVQTVAVKEPDGGAAAVQTVATAATAAEAVVAAKLAAATATTPIKAADHVSERWHTADPPTGSERWHTADPPTGSEPWRPDPEPEQADATAKAAGTPSRSGQPLGSDRAAFQQHLSVDMTTATESVLTGDFSPALVTKLEEIVKGYATLLGPEHESTIRAGKILIRAKAGLSELSTPEARSDAPVTAPPAEHDADDDSEDHFRSKTTRRGAGERQPHARRSSKGVTAVAVGEVVAPSDVLCLAFSGGPARLLGIGGIDGVASVVAPGAEPRTLANGPLPVRQLTFGLSEQFVVCLLGAGDRPERLRIWSVDGRPNSRDGVVASHFASHSPEMFVTASGGHDLSLRTFSAPFTPVARYRGLAELGDVAVSPDGAHVAAIGDHQIVVWRAFTGTQIASFAAPDAQLELGLQFSPDGTALFASHTRDGMIRCELATGRARRCVPPALADQRPVWALAPGGLAVGMPFHGARAQATFWDVAWPEDDLGTLPDPICPTVRPAFDAGGRLLAVALPDRRTVRIYDLAH